MNGFDRILFPVDFSPRCRLAIPYVGAIARLYKADVTLLHVEEILPMEGYGWEPHTELLGQKLKDFMPEELEGLNVEHVVRTGDPALEIIRHVKDNGTNLVMMPTRGNGPFRRFLLGSITAKILHDAPCAVWTSAHLEEERPPATEGIRNILCAVDLNETGRTITLADQFAKRIGAGLTVAHVVPYEYPTTDRFGGEDLRQDLVEAARIRLTEMLARAGVQAIVCVAAGKVADIVKHAAQAHGAGLVVIGRNSHSLLGRLRTNSYAIIRECECPVLSV